MSNKTINFFPLPIKDFEYSFPEPTACVKYIPEWYKDQPSSFSKEGEDRNKNLTVKKCIPFFDSMSMGYFLKMPVDLYINTKDGKKECSIQKEFSSVEDIMIGWHSSEHISNYPADFNIYLKDLFRINPMWMTKTPPGYSTLFMSPMHQNHIPLKAIEAVVDTDNFLTAGLNSFFLQKDFEGIIKQGTPIIQAIPFKRESWEMCIDLNHDPEEITKQRKRGSGLYPNAYRKWAWEKKNFS
jgi:hypothetical protein